MKYSINRREFLKSGLLALATASWIGASSRSFQAFAKDAKVTTKEIPLPPGAEAAPESDGLAAAIGYKAHEKDIDFNKYPQRKLPANKGQYCDNCALYVKTNEGWGKCQMLASNPKWVVSAKGWCGSWSKKS